MPSKKSYDSGATTLHIKNMVCNRCIKVVREELEKLGHDVRSIVLGEVIVGRGLTSPEMEQIKGNLLENGFELIEDRRAKTIERVKIAVLDLIRSGKLESGFEGRYSAYLAKELEQDYHAFSSLFSSMEGVTIEQYIILQKIERVKELLKYGELTLSEISYKLDYSSVAHLSNQFKKVTGMTPSAFKSLVGNTRVALDAVKPARS